MINRERRVAVYTGTRNLYPDMVPAIKSLIAHSDVDKVYLLIEDDEFPFEVPKDIVEVRNVSEQTYFKPDGPNMKSGFTYMAMMRAALCKEFPELDEILALDCDTICVRDITDIWNTPLYDEYYFAAVPETARTTKSSTYTNIGVALYNLKKLRDGKADEVIDILNTKKYTYLEQDVFNLQCQGAIYKLSSDYNATNYTKPTSNPKIVHYAGIKDWSDVDLVNRYRDTSWEEILKYRKRRQEEKKNRG